MAGTGHVALLRGVNVGGATTVSMSALRDLYSTLGLDDVRSLLQSGNVVFRSTGRAAAQLERLLEAETDKRFGRGFDTFVRTAADWSAVVSGNPFPEAATRDPGHLLVLFLKDAPAGSQVSALQKAIKGREIARARGRHLYIVYPDGVGRSKLTLTLIEKVLETRGTGRNWNTVIKLGELVSA